MTNGKKTAIIILNYNNDSDTINCICSIETHSTADAKIVVVDNGSNETTVNSIHHQLKDKFGEDYTRIEEGENVKYPLNRVTYLVSQTNDGYANGNNKGLKLVQHDKEIDYVMILNNDVLFVDDIIPRLVDYAEKNENCAIVSPILYKKDFQGIDYNCARIHKSEWDIILGNFDFLKIDVSKYRILEKQPEKIENEVIPIDLPSGSCMLLRKQLFEEIGWFDPHTFLYYEEDILCQKISRIGLNNYLLPGLRCIHLGASSTRKSRNTFLIKAAFKSQSYYLEHYCQLTAMQRILKSFSSIYVKFKLIYLQSKLSILTYCV